MCLKVALDSSQERCCPVLFGITELALVFLERRGCGMEEQQGWGAYEGAGSERNMMRQSVMVPSLAIAVVLNGTFLYPRGHLAISRDILVITACG